MGYNILFENMGCNVIKIEQSNRDAAHRTYENM